MPVIYWFQICKLVVIVSSVCKNLPQQPRMTFQVMSFTGTVKPKQAWKNGRKNDDYDDGDIVLLAKHC